MDTGAFSPRVKRQKREADNTPLTGAEVKNDRAVPPLQHTSRWLGRVRAQAVSRQLPNVAALKQVFSEYFRFLYQFLLHQ
jgi:hypothetical protein